MKMEEYDCWYLDWRGKKVGEETVVRQTVEGWNKACNLMHEALRGSYSSQIGEGKSCFYYSNQRGLVGMMTPRR